MPNLSGEEQQEYIKLSKKGKKAYAQHHQWCRGISKIEAGLMQVYLRESNINEQIKYIYTFF
jgi:hypothetical protein